MGVKQELSLGMDNASKNRPKPSINRYKAHISTTKTYVGIYENLGKKPFSPIKNLYAVTLTQVGISWLLP